MTASVSLRNAPSTPIFGFDKHKCQRQTEPNRSFSFTSELPKASPNILLKYHFDCRSGSSGRRPRSLRQNAFSGKVLLIGADSLYDRNNLWRTSSPPTGSNKRRCNSARPTGLQNLLISLQHAFTGGSGFHEQVQGKLTHQNNCDVVPISDDVYLQWPFDLPCQCGIVMVPRNCDGAILRCSNDAKLLCRCKIAITRR